MNSRCFQQAAGKNEPGSAGKTGEAPWIPLGWIRELPASSHPLRKGHGRCWGAGKDLRLTSSAKKMGKCSRAWTRALEKAPELSEGTELSPRNVCAAAAAPSPAGHKLSLSIPFPPVSRRMSGILGRLPPKPRLLHVLNKKKQLSGRGWREPGCNDSIYWVKMYGSKCTGKINSEGKKKNKTRGDSEQLRALTA